MTLKFLKWFWWLPAACFLIGYYAGYKKLHWDDGMKPGASARVMYLRNQLEIWQSAVFKCQHMVSTCTCDTNKWTEDEKYIGGKY